MKKTLSLFLALCLSLTLLPFGALAEEPSFSYTIENGEATITGASPPIGTLVIPETIEGCPVTAIGDRAFYDAEALSGISFPQSLRSIGEEAFEYAGLIGTLRIPKGVKSIGDAAFYGSKISNVRLPDGLETLGKHAFSECKSLLVLSVPAGITSLDRTIRRCESLRVLMLPASIKSFGDSTFDGDFDLTDIYFGGTRAQWDAIPKRNTADFDEYFERDDLTIHFGGAMPDPVYALYDLPDASHWAYPGVIFCLESGLMKGMDDFCFHADGKTTRAQLVTILWRMAGSPWHEGSSSLRDLTQDWYKPAVLWAFRNQITTGEPAGPGDASGTYFRPDRPVSREELVTFLQRFTEKIFDLPTDAGGDLSSFPDEWRVSNWAVNALRWAVGNDVLHGTDVGGVAYLDPQGSATRAQIATLMRNYALNILG